MRTSRRTTVPAAVAALALALTGAACTGADGTDAGTDTEEPIILDPGEEQGESLLPADPDAGTGTDG